MCMSIFINKHTAYTFTYVGTHKQIRIPNQSALLMIISDIYQMYNYFYIFPRIYQCVWPASQLGKLKSK